MSGFRSSTPHCPITRAGLAKVDAVDAPLLRISVSMATADAPSVAVVARLCDATAFLGFFWGYHVGSMVRNRCRDVVGF